MSRWPTHDNPFGMTPRQAQAMNAICDHGCYKLAAAALNISVSSLEQHLGAANGRVPGRTRLQRILAWDRWRQSLAVGTQTP